MKRTEKIGLYSFKSVMESDNSIARTYVGITENGHVFIKRVCLNQNDLTIEGWDLIRKTKFGNYYMQSLAFKDESFKSIVYILNREFNFFGFQQSESKIKEDNEFAEWLENGFIYIPKFDSYFAERKDGSIDFKSPMTKSHLYKIFTKTKEE